MKTLHIVGRVVTCIAVAVLVIVLWVLASNTAIERRLAIGAIEQWNSAAFYETPNDIPDAEPGTIYKTERLYSIFDGADAWRVIYYSKDLYNKTILVSGTVIAPKGPAPKEGRPIMSWGHPTVGVAQRCAPSSGLAPFDFIEGLRAFIEKGYVVTATDYSGMGVAGPSAFLIGVTEGNNVLDIAKAARHIPEAKAGKDLVLWGHSQGGQATLFAGQQAPNYAPELSLKAVAVAAPATNLSELLSKDIDDVSGVSIGTYAFNSYSSVYGASRGAELEAILTDAGVVATPKMAEFCLLGQNKELHQDAAPLIGNYLKADPSTTEPWATLLKENSFGSAQLLAPLFVAQGQKDTLVKPEITREFVAQQKAAGTQVTFSQLPNATHGTVALDSIPALLKWISEQML